MKEIEPMTPEQKRNTICAKIMRKESWLDDMTGFDLDNIEANLQWLKDQQNNWQDDI